MKKMRGITLIALIITIIVMLILVGVTVTTAINGGLFKQAQEAKNRHEEEYIKEQIQIALVSSIDERLMKYDEHTSGNVNLLVLKQELTKVFETKVDMTIKVVVPFGEDGYTEVTDDKLKEGYNAIFNGDPFGELTKAVLNLGELQIQTNGKIFRVTTTGKILLVETTGEVITTGEAMPYWDLTRAFKLNSNANILKYKGKEKIVKIPNSYYRETEKGNVNSPITQLGAEGKHDTGNNGGYNEYWSIFLVNGGKIPIKDLLLTEDEQRNEIYLDFKEENYDQIMEIITSAGLNLTGVSNFNELKNYMHAYQENGEWYTTFVEEGDTVKFVDKNELSGVETVVIPEGVVKVCNYALAGDPFLTKVYIPASLISQESAEAIGGQAFEGANPNLKIYITTPEGWGATEKKAAISKFASGFKDLEAEQFVWSDEEAYIAP